MNFIIMLFSVLSSCKKEAPLKINEIQTIGSHNSYKQRIQKELKDILYSKDSIQAMELDYGHLPLVNQLNMGLRGLELDVFYDPKGGRFVAPLGQELIKNQNGIPQGFDKEETLKKPGLKVFHIQEIDFRSHCLLFTEGLKELKIWSKSHPEHLPIIITINAKDKIIDIPDFRHPLPFNAEALNVIDKEIRAVLDESQLITPDLVRENSATLEEAILTKGWPTLEESKGKFLFVLDEGGEKQEAYIENHPSLQNRVMFTNSSVGNPEAAFLIINDPIKNKEQIKNFVKQGYLVRTRADAGTWEARKNDYNRWQAALESGAQLISTDYYIKDTILKTGYQIKFEDGDDHRLNPLFLK